MINIRLGRREICRRMDLPQVQSARWQRLMSTLQVDHGC
jgi:hypothetical protein